MCVIVDNNHRDKFLHSEPDLLPIRKAVLGGRTALVYGGRLTDEYRKSADMKRYLRVLLEMGAAREIPRDNVDREEQCIAGACRSDDPHIIALVRVGNVRLLCTEDKDLMDDFRNHELINHPRGSIYPISNRREGDRLIRQHCQCHHQETKP